MFSVLPKEYFSTAMEVLEYFQGSTAVLAKEYWKVSLDYHSPLRDFTNSSFASLRISASNTS